MPNNAFRLVRCSVVATALCLLPGCEVVGGLADLATTIHGMRNLMVNGDAEAGDLSGWTTQGDWAAIDSVKAGGERSFATSYLVSTRYQEVDLVAAMFTEAQLDSGPEVTMRDWVGTRADCGGHYFVRFELLDANHNVLASHAVGSPDDLRPIAPGTAFFAVEHRFSPAPPGLRYLRVSDGGRDDRRWAGFFGPHFDDAEASLAVAPATD